MEGLVVTLPSSWDGRRGIRKWLPLGNDYYDDCVVAAILHLMMVHNVSRASSWKRLMYNVGFKVPTNGIAKADYFSFMASVGEQPTMGVNPYQFFPWLVSQGKVKEWSSITISDAPSPDKMATIHSAMVDWDGAMVFVELTNRAYQDGLSDSPWTLDSGEIPNPALAHAVAAVSYSPSMDGWVTWGRMKSASPAFISACAYALFVFS